MLSQSNGLIILDDSVSREIIMFGSKQETTEAKANINKFIFNKIIVYILFIKYANFRSSSSYLVHNRFVN